MKKNFVVTFVTGFALMFTALIPMAHAESAWATDLKWSNLHVKSEDGVFENWHREWKVEKPADLFATDKIDFDSPTQHNLAWVRTPRNSFTSTYNGGVSQANKQITFVFQGYNEDGDAMNYTVSSPLPSGSPSASPIVYPAPVKKTIADSPTYFSETTVTTDDTGYAAVTVTLNAKALAYQSIISSIRTEVGQADATVSAPYNVVKKTTKIVKGKKVTTTTTTPFVKASYAPIAGAKSYQYSLDAGSTWIDAPESPIALVASSVSQANGVKIRAHFTLGPQVVTWQNPGWRPVIKLVGTTNGRQCDVNANVPSKYLCSDIDIKDQTFDWSVANRAWFQGSQAYDYAQAYAKSYSAGSTLGLRFFVRDIWGTPQKNLPLTVALNSSKTKWNKYPSTIKTDSSGYATFTAKNMNTAAQVKANVDVNPDPPHVKTVGVLGFVISITSNEIDEVADQMWFQLVPEVTVDGKYPNSTDQVKYPRGTVDFPIKKRGPNVTDETDGNYWVNDQVKNPALTLDSPTGTQTLDDVIIAAIALNRLKNILNAPIYAPDVTITATNGGMAALATAAQKANDFIDFKDSSKFKSTLTFGYNYYQDLVFMATKPGTTTWTVSVGKWSYSFSQDYVAPPS